MARFHESTGRYEIDGLPGGHVRAALAADGFTAGNERLAVGTLAPRELVLHRRDPLLDASGTLSGIAWASTNGTSAYTGVKIEVLDGPLAGVFTVTDENFGMYRLSGLPPGLLRVRASAAWLQPKTTTVIVQSNTRLDFVLARR